MTTSSRTASVSLLGLVLVLSPVADMQAAELQVLAGGGITGPLRELGPQFESVSGHKLVFRFGTTPELIKLATSGGPFDLGGVPREVFKDADAQARFTSGPTTDIARVGLGVSVRSGAPRPDISTPDSSNRRCSRRSRSRPYRPARPARRFCGRSTASASARR